MYLDRVSELSDDVPRSCIRVIGRCTETWYLI